MISQELLKWYPLFAGLSPYLAKEIALISNEIEVKEGEWLFYEEAESDKFYIVIEGSISLTTNIYLNGQSRNLEVVDPIGPNCGVVITSRTAYLYTGRKSQRGQQAD